MASVGCADDQVAVAYASAFRRHLTELGRRYEVADVPATTWFLILSCSSFLPAQLNSLAYIYTIFSLFSLNTMPT
ncbi:hypothetical protein T08_8298 [Trichinella sp. T8]|nr:hypothetical protein T08_8298 [Trichinella sp. T8]